MYNSFVSRYLVALCRIWFMYHVYAKKVIGCRIFKITVGHLACHYVILPIFSKGFGIPSMVQLVALTFLGCWILITHAFVIYFQWDDRPIFLNVMKHWDQHFFFPTSIMGYPSFTTPCYPLSSSPFWKYCGTIVSSLTSFFDGLFTWIVVCHTFRKCSNLDTTWTHLGSCASLVACV